MSLPADELSSIVGLDRAGLVERWAAEFGYPAPRSCQARLLRGTLAWHVQMQASPEWRGAANLGRLVRSLRPSAQAPSLAPGTRLLRQWQGRTHHVTVTPRGFEYGGKTYRSLTAIARHITGTAWGGPLFFGLRR